MTHELCRDEGASVACRRSRSRTVHRQRETDKQRETVKQMRETDV
jgi:hypothetical protein